MHGSGYFKVSGTTVVETVSGGWPQVLSEPKRLLQAGQLAARTRAERLR